MLIDCKPVVAGSTEETFVARAERVISRCRELSRITDVPGQTTRTFLSPATRDAHALLTHWMREAGLKVTVDRIGNLRAIRSDEADKPRLVIASHIDTVVNAGAFDGPLGVMLGLDLVQSFAAGELPFAIELIAFSEEEGVRFHKPFLGSLSLIGEPASLELADGAGVTLENAIRDFGHEVTVESGLVANTFGYLEFHIEQGPVLEAEARPIAAVSAITGMTRLRVSFCGQANHAGTTPMHLRRDALAAAAQWIMEVEAYAKSQNTLVATVGSIEAMPGVGNVIPGKVVASLDLRHAEDAVRHRAVQRVIEAAMQAAALRGVTCEVEPGIDQAAVFMDSRLVHLLVKAASTNGYDASPIPSGAGHDAMIVARRIPSAMLFLRTPSGLSHHPDEVVLLADVEAALATGTTFLRTLIPEIHHA